MFAGRSERVRVLERDHQMPFTDLARRRRVPTRSQVVAARPEAFAEARRFVREAVAGSAPTQVLHDSILLTSELVTNAVRHAGRSADDPVEIIVSIDARTLRVTVRDRGSGFDPTEVRDRSDDGGWGLDLVRRLSSRWGVEPRPGGTDVWFEVDLSDRER